MKCSWALFSHLIFKIAIFKPNIVNANFSERYGFIGGISHITCSLCFIYFVKQISFHKEAMLLATNLACLKKSTNG